MWSGASAQSRSQIGAPFVALFALLNLAVIPHAQAILAGGETALPADSPANRLDLLGAASQVNAIGAGHQFWRFFLPRQRHGHFSELGSNRRAQS